MLLELAFGLVLLSLTVMGLAHLLGWLFRLRYRSLRNALTGLVDGAGVPKGLRSGALVERALADPRIDPLSAGIPGPDDPVRPAARVTWVEPFELGRAVRDAVARTNVTLLVDGLSVRPPAVQEEVKREIAAVGDKVAARFATHFGPAMLSCAEGFKMTMRVLSVLLGVPAAVLFGVFGPRPPAGMDPTVLAVASTAIGVVVIPVLAAAWYGLLRNVAKLRPEAGAARASAPRPASEPRGEPRGGSRSGHGGRGSGGRPGPATEGASPPPAPAGGGGAGGGSPRRRGGRRSSGRRGGGRPGPGNGGESGGGGPGGAAPGGAPAGNG